MTDIYAAADGPKRRPGLSLARANSKLLAKRLHWPAGALEACWDLERRFPGWRVSWLGENTRPGWERPAGYWATMEAHQQRIEAFRPDVADLVLILCEGVPEHDWSINGCPWCVVHGRMRIVRL